MKASVKQARKRPVNLTLSEDLVAEAKGFTDNLSAIVESLLTHYVAREKEARLAQRRGAESASELWNEFNDRAAGSNAGTAATPFSTAVVHRRTAAASSGQPMPRWRRRF